MLRGSVKGVNGGCSSEVDIYHRCLAADATKEGKTRPEQRTMKGQWIRASIVVICHGISCSSLMRRKILLPMLEDPVSLYLSLHLYVAVSLPVFAIVHVAAVFVSVPVSAFLSLSFTVT